MVTPSLVDLTDEPTEPFHKPEVRTDARAWMKKRTLELPSGTFLGAAAGCAALSAACAVLSRRKDVAGFLGLWAPTILLVGLYVELLRDRANSA